MKCQTIDKVGMAYHLQIMPFSLYLYGLTIYEEEISKKIVMKIYRKILFIHANNIYFK